jgi:hypothetical protein
MLITAMRVSNWRRDTGATHPFPFIFIMGRRTKIKQGDYEYFKELLELCLAKNVKEV